MGFADRFRRLRKNVGAGIGGEHVDHEAELKVGMAMYDDWDIVADFNDLDTARAWKQLLWERGMNSVLTSDYPLDRFGRGDISLRVEPGLGIEAEELLEGDDD